VARWAFTRAWCMTSATLARPPALRISFTASASSRLLRPRDDAGGPGPELGVGGPHVDHQAPVGLAQEHEGGGGQGITHQLGGGPGLEAGRAGDHLGPGAELDDQIGDGPLVAAALGACR
jgi:hypothetical protein